MKKLFALKNIGIQPITDLYSDKINIAYTGKLLQLGVLIEFRGVVFENEPYLPEEILVFANICANGIIHSYVLFVSHEVLGPLPVFRVIADAIEFIEQCKAGSVIEELKQVATSYSAIDKSYENKEYYKNELWKYTRALGLIRKKREQVN
ncbi:hypothetical protein [Chryseobacterium viscerum]|uniref:Uncharacterized protein n=1 Tax=Chryseobacterium viscerum TaxID=1037377 RepID=A0A316WRS2_9FLAO|nr:hypothetical protein [Chryseobacterium viscerum]PWN64134.1 hypothetical protein C1634_005950 [Chryseobacterium viscerum]